MSLMLPTTPRPLTVRPRLISAGTNLSSPLGGATQRINRLGDRIGLDITLPRLKHLSCGSAWMTYIFQAQTQSVTYYLPPSLLIFGSAASPGAPVVNGSSNAGLSLAVRGLSAFYPFVKGQWISIIVSGRRYLHMITADVIATIGGTVTLPILPMLRVRPADGATIEVTAPIIEGLMTSSASFENSKFRTDGFDTVSIDENQ